ncbi:MAG: cell division protein FtsA [Hydrogenibacillus sp.]|nr:cell division protein FtsA [Hydrogenibacillus sp.]
MGEPQYLAALDLGSYKIRLVVAEWTGGAYHVVGVGSAPSQGVKKGAVVDIEAAGAQIRTVVEQAERMIDRPIHGAFVGVGGESVALMETKGVVAVGHDDREIRQDDVDRVIEAAKIVNLPPDRVIIDVVPSAFAVDSLSGVRDPRGMLGMRLEMTGSLVSASRTAIHNVLRTLERADVEPYALVLPAYGAGWALLEGDERAAGTVAIDMGAQTTTVAVWQEDVLRDLFVLPFGGAYVTHDIAHGLGTSLEVAEELKLKHGTSTVGDAAESVVFKVPQVGRGTPLALSQVELAEIIEPRLVEMLTLIRDALADRGQLGLPAGIAWSGGTSAIPGFLPLARSIVHEQSRLVYPDQLGVRDPSFAAAVGMIEYAVRFNAFRLPDGVKTAARGSKRSAAMRREDADGGLLAKVKNWLSEFI